MIPTLHILGHMPYLGKTIIQTNNTTVLLLFFFPWKSPHLLYATKFGDQSSSFFFVNGSIKMITSIL